MNQSKKNWHHSLFYFLSAQTISLFGSSIVQYAIVWYITLTTSSGKMLTLSTLCGFVPQFIVSFFAGVWIDRYNRKKIIMLADSMISGATLILALAFLSGYRKFWLLFLVLIIRSIGTGIQTPAVNAILPQIVPQEYLLRVNGINSTLSSLTMFLSPAVSGAILSMISLEGTLFLDVITAMIGVGITFIIPIPSYKRKAAKTNSMLSELKEGFSYLQQNIFFKKLLFYQLFILFFISPTAFLTPLMVSRIFGEEIWRLTTSEMTYSFGMVLGGILITTWGGFHKRIYTTLVSGAIYGMMMIGLGFAPFYSIYLICNTIIGITSPCYNTPITALIQEKVEPSIQGRIFSLMQISTSCALPIGMAFFGPIADFFPIEFLFIICGCFVAISSIYLGISHYFTNE